MLIADPDPLLAALLLALLLDWLLGDPPWLWRRLPHPVALIGWAIGRLEVRWNRSDLADAERRRSGRRTVLLVVAASAVLGLLLQGVLLDFEHGWIVLGVLMSTLIAYRSLERHVTAVADGLDEGLTEGRAAVAHIVGRDPASLDDAAVARAAIESTAENFADGVVAPLLWGLLLGLPGMVAYKAINTADSMIGHKTGRYLQFGGFAARLDDLVNLPASRLAMVLLVLAALLEPDATPAGAVRAVRADARRHRSPNAGWPEAAMAGALRLSLAGPRTYDGKVVDDAWMGGGRSYARPRDIRRALGLMKWAFLLLSALVLAVALAAARPS
ncbi:MAG TPA: adenosylcobinamide-phosphate synthase CbiB [Geminicoccaceae bacterium]